MKKLSLKIFVIGLGSGFLLAGCAEGGGDLGTPAENETGTESSSFERPAMEESSGQTNIQDGANPTAAGAGSAVGGDPSGAGTQPLRDEENL